MIDEAQKVGKVASFWLPPSTERMLDELRGKWGSRSRSAAIVEAIEAAWLEAFNGR
ncbi:MAG: hypothetical protein WC211_03785 [Dehalococcoidia bacterium]